MTTETRKRREYTEDFKRDAVALVTEQGYKASEAARSLSIGDNLIRRWKREFEEEASGAQLGADELHRLHHPIEVEAARLLARREFAEALQQLADVTCCRSDDSHMLYEPAIVTIASYSARSNGSMRKLVTIGARSSSKGCSQTCRPWAFCFRNVILRLS